MANNAESQTSSPSIDENCRQCLLLVCILKIVLQQQMSASRPYLPRQLTALRGRLHGFMLLRHNFPKAAIGTLCSYHAQIHIHFNHERYLKTRLSFKQKRATALTGWFNFCAA